MASRTPRRGAGASRVKPLFLRAARGYVRWRMRRAFDGVFVHGLERARHYAERGPIIVAANHVCWWDALTILTIDAALTRQGHCVMDAANLAKLPFFAWLGAVPLDRDSPRQALRDLDASLALLDGPMASLWIFPQGEQRPAHVTPLGLQPGVFWLAKKSGATVLPLSLNYLYRQAPEPAVVASFGARLPVVAGARRDAERAFMEGLERELRDGLARCDRHVMSGEGAFHALLPPRRAQVVPFAGRFLAQLGDRHA